MSAWAAYLCSQRGFHERVGSSSGEATVWSRYCAICGAWIGPPAPSEAGGNKPIGDTSSDAKP